MVSIIDQGCYVRMDLVMISYSAIHNGVWLCKLVKYKFLQINLCSTQPLLALTLVHVFTQDLKQNDKIDKYMFLIKESTSLSISKSPSKIPLLCLGIPLRNMYYCSGKEFAEVSGEQ